jgi:hypothetical protein
MTTFSTEQRNYAVDAKLIPLGFEQITGLSALKSLKPPKDARVAVIQAVTQNVRWRDDGTSPTSTVGMQLAAGRDMLYTSNLATLQLIEETPSAEVNVSYYF